MNQTPTAAVEGKLRSSTNQPNPTGSPAQPANQILRCGCCNNPRMKFESLVSVDSCKHGTLQNFPPAKHILTQLDVATGSGSGRIADIFHCSHRSMPTFGLICGHQTCKITELSHHVGERNARVTKHRSIFGVAKVICMFSAPSGHFWAHTYVVHPPPDSHEDVDEPCLDSALPSLRLLHRCRSSHHHRSTL